MNMPSIPMTLNPRLSPIAFLRLMLLLAMLVSAVRPSPAFAQLPLHPDLDASIAPNMRRIALGDWGESVTAQLFRDRGFEVHDFTVGRHGLDQVALKRDAAGALLDVRAVEVKARTAAGDLGLPGTSRDGLQLTAEKLDADLRLVASRHPDPKARGLAREILDVRAARPSAVRAERHVLTVADGQYTIYEGATNARPVGRPVARGSVDAMFERLGRSTNPETAAAARLNRAYLRTQQGLVPSAAEIPVVARPPTAGAAIRGRAAPRVRTAAPRLGAATGAVAAGAATFVAVAGFATYDWYQGTISDARLHEELIRAGGDGLAVGLATGGILLLTPAAPGLVLVAVAAGVAITADLAFDWAMERENEHLIDREMTIRYGYVPDPAGADPGAALPPLRNPLAEAWPGEPAIPPAEPGSADGSLVLSAGDPGSRPPR